MKKLFVVSLLLFSPFLQAGNKWKVQLPGGGMRFQGEVIAEGCTVETSDQNLIVNMGQVRTNTFDNPGQDSAPTAFDIHLRECSDSVSDYISIAFKGVANERNPDIFSISDGPNTARGVGLAIFDSKNTLIPVNSAPRKVANLRNGDMTLHFVAKYRSTSEAIVVGKANAQALFSLTYE
ncbi:TPA: fimbrial protein [Providencia alcalifaciens]